MNIAIKGKKRNHKENARLTGLLDIISPTALEFQSKTIVNGELYQRVLVIIDYPERVRGAWLSRIATLPGVVVSIHSTPTESDELLQDINVAAGELESKLITGGNKLLVKRTERQLEAAERLISKIDNESQAVFMVTVTILIHADDLDELQRRTRRVEASLKSSGMRGRIPMFRQEEAFKTVGPYGILAPEIAEIGARNMPVETLASMYPFVYSGINDGTGNLLGSDKSGGIVLVDFWVREGSRTNSNITVIGRPGVGKSTVVKKILLKESVDGTKVLIIDPEREYKDLCENLNGDWIDCGGGLKGRINPLQVRSVPLDEEEESDPLYSQEDINRGALGLHFQFLRTFFRLYIKELTKIQQGLLEIALEEVYKKYGITWDTDPQTIPNENWPTVIDLQAYCEEQSENAIKHVDAWSELALLLRPAAKGADKALWAGHTTIDPKSNFICLDINQLLDADDEIRKAQYFNILSWSWDQISRDRTEKVILASDETYLLVDPDTPQPLQFLRNTSKRIRKYEGSLMVITHNMVDFMDNAVRRYGQALLDNPVYKIIMGQGENDIDALKRLMNLSEIEVQTLLAGNRGEALLVAGNRRIHASIEVAPFELEMFGKAGGR
ncbi:VirB4 family type IV secretion system protein [Paenibacillus campinasensis]|uniref:Conjugal transfer protein TraC n=1 Tax=Paenibacillus campinasensis TaxID=66347 RepID=A0A268EE05_9BACL|nr:ATP-binding protein [Paenibacillus campinasensis]PAD71347.1 conjugal transfer protein TraC [Paenibacillus campinasensis]